MHVQSLAGAEPEQWEQHAGQQWQQHIWQWSFQTKAHKVHVQRHYVDHG